ncbi:GTPase HflX [Liberiplasma polymorphum]|uniref:GTPase HflX n=1 Tax=Liberiplasma polymorphum TaxID=3374570 RepID=UPI003772EE8A
MKNAILVGVDYCPKNKISIYMEELRALTQTLNIDVKSIFTQDGKQASAQYKIGTGKVEELKEYIDDASIDLVIFNDELTGSQIRNLEAALDKPVIDRTLLILDIFAKRAKTKEAMLQVEVAQLKYMLPRLTSLHASFEKQQGGIGSRGPGEKKIELDRRKIENEINHLQKELSNIVQVRQSNRKQRKNSLIKTVAIVGYTNAGKSTLMNTLLEYSKASSDKDVHVKDQLFATLETSSRRIELPNTKPFVLTDTIGFVSNLPVDLVDSFKSTLEEIQEADLLLHVVDFSNPYYFYQIMTTQKVLEELGADEIETLYVFNKIDLNQENLPHGFTPSVKISLTDKTNIDLLLEKVIYMLSKDDAVVVYRIPYDKGNIVNVLTEYSQILEKSHDEHGTVIKARVSSVLRHQYKEFEI